MMDTRPVYRATLPMVERMTWHDILQRLRGIGAKVPSGAARIDLTILLLDGEPAQWFEPCIQRLEPRRAAEQFVRQLPSQPDE